MTNREKKLKIGKLPGKKNTQTSQNAQKTHKKRRRFRRNRKKAKKNQNKAFSFPASQPALRHASGALSSAGSTSGWPPGRRGSAAPCPCRPPPTPQSGPTPGVAPPPHCHHGRPRGRGGSCPTSLCDAPTSPSPHLTRCPRPCRGQPLSQEPTPHPLGWGSPGGSWGVNLWSQNYF